MNLIRLYQVDAFASDAYRGNPAGVCILSQPVKEDWMRALAAEMNLSETAFLLPEGDGYRLRWFTPAVEVSLCGHATLASAHILFEQGYLSPDRQALFETRSGRLTATQTEDWITLDFPTRPTISIQPDPDLMTALGITHVIAIGQSRSIILIEVPDENAVRAIQPDFARLKTLPPHGVIVTSRSNNPDYDIVSRFFAPVMGVNEDPVTGSAHCALAPYWHEKLGKADIMAFQASARGGVLFVHHCGERTLLQGKAVTIFIANLTNQALPES